MSFLYDQRGGRKYINGIERVRFIEASHSFPDKVQTFCFTLALSGARISEVLALSPARFDFIEQAVRIECLKKRQRGIFRDIPVPTPYLHWLDQVYGLRASQQDPKTAHKPIWPWCRTTAWKRVKEVMTEAEIFGTQACPKGLRHGFGVGTALVVPIMMTQKWLGHAQLGTTAIYTNAVDDEERALASRFWDTLPNINQ